MKPVSSVSNSLLGSESLYDVVQQGNFPFDPYLDQMPSVAEASRTLFVGDLSYFCGEEDLCNLFAQFGPILTVRVRRGVTGESLMHGFIALESAEAAQRAISQLDGIEYMGRNMRVQLSSDGQKANQQSKDNFVQVHVSFISKQLNFIITEKVLRDIFEPCGPIADVAIKKHTVIQKQHRQSGYGFVYFYESSSAYRAMQLLKQHTVRDITLDCSISHKSEHLIRGGQPTTPQQIQQQPSPHNTLNVQQHATSSRNHIFLMQQQQQQQQQVANMQPTFGDNTTTTAASAATATTNGGYDITAANRMINGSTGLSTIVNNTIPIPPPIDTSRGTLSRAATINITNPSNTISVTADNNTAAAYRQMMMNQSVQPGTYLATTPNNNGVLYNNGNMVTVANMNSMNTMNAMTEQYLNTASNVTNGNVLSGYSNMTMSPQNMLYTTNMSGAAVAAGNNPGNTTVVNNMMYTATGQAINLNPQPRILYHTNGIPVQLSRGYSMNAVPSNVSPMNMTSIQQGTPMYSTGSFDMTNGSASAGNATTPFNPMNTTNGRTISTSPYPQQMHGNNTLQVHQLQQFQQQQQQLQQQQQQQLQQQQLQQSQAQAQQQVQQQVQAHQQAALFKASFPLNKILSTDSTTSGITTLGSRSTSSEMSAILTNNPGMFSSNSDLNSSYFLSAPSPMSSSMSMSSNSISSPQGPSTGGGGNGSGGIGPHMLHRMNGMHATMDAASSSESTTPTTIGNHYHTNTNTNNAASAAASSSSLSSSGSFYSNSYHNYTPSNHSHTAAAAAASMNMPGFLVPSNSSSFYLPSNTNTNHSSMNPHYSSPASATSTTAGGANMNMNSLTNYKAFHDVLSEIHPSSMNNHNNNHNHHQQAIMTHYPSSTIHHHQSSPSPSLSSSTSTSLLDTTGNTGVVGEDNPNHSLKTSTTSLHHLQQQQQQQQPMYHPQYHHYHSSTTATATAPSAAVSVNNDDFHFGDLLLSSTTSTGNTNNNNSNNNNNPSSIGSANALEYST